LPSSKDGKRFNTRNTKGFMYATINRNEQEFVELACSAPSVRALDIGCAFGHVCLAALEKVIFAN